MRDFVIWKVFLTLWEIKSSPDCKFIFFISFFFISWCQKARGVKTWYCDSRLVLYLTVVHTFFFHIAIATLVIFSTLKILLVSHSLAVCLSVCLSLQRCFYYTGITSAVSVSSRLSSAPLSPHTPRLFPVPHPPRDRMG